MALLFTLPRVSTIDLVGEVAPRARLYFYQTGTTTPQPVYADSGLTTALEQPVTASDVGLFRGIYLNDALGSYKVVCHDEDGSELWSIDPYLTGPSQSQIGVALYPRTQSEQSANITPTNYWHPPGYVKRYGGAFDNSTNDSLAWNRAVLALGSNGGVVYGAIGTSYIGDAGGIFLAPNVVIELMGGTLRGTGNTTGGNIGIQTATYVSGVLTANAGSGINLTRAQVRNGQLHQFGTGLKLSGAIDACAFSNLLLSDCYRGVFATFCLYSTFSNIMARGSSGEYGFRFSDNCNAITIKNCYAVGGGSVGTTYDYGFKFDAKTYSTKLLNCSSEWCDTGILTEELHGLDIDGHYFEAITDYGINLQGSAAGRKVGVRVASCFFANTDHLVYGRTVNEFVWEATNDRAADCVPGDIDLQNESTITDGELSACTGVVRINRFDIISINPTTVAVPSWLTLSDGIQLDAVVAASRDGGLATPVYAKAQIHTGANQGIIPFCYSGYGGSLSGFVPFCAHAGTGTGTFNVNVDTQITHDDYNFVAYKFVITDNIGTYTCTGRVVGTTVYADAAGKTVVASNNSGKLRLQIQSLDHPSGTYTLTGVVRHL